MKASMTRVANMRNNKLTSSLVISVGLALAISGCTRGASLNQGGVLPTQQSTPGVSNLKPAPLTPVKSSKLEPTSPTPPPVSKPAAPKPIPATPTVEAPKPKPVKVAKVSAANAKPVTRQALVGAWTVSSGSSNCQLFLALTKWSGGYRAAPRGCAATAISNVAAWDVKGKEVILVGAGGEKLATLYRSAGERFDGSTSSGGSISLSR
ncbi:MAG: protease inhibitor Inh/omp19 family protein [Rhizobiaceae bacterium]